MIHYKIDIYDRFECIGSSCPNTCCTGWPIGVDDAATQHYEDVPEDLRQRIKEGLYEKNGHTYIKLDAAGTCPFLDEEKLCEIYKKLGPDRMWYVCQRYPRVAWSIGDVSFAGLSNSCPEVVRILFTHTDPLRLAMVDDGLSPLSSADIDWELSNALTNGLVTCIGFLTDRTLSFSVRLRLLILFYDALQECIDTHSDCSALLTAFSSPDNYHPLASTLQAIPTDYTTRISLIRRLGIFEGLVRVNFLVEPASHFLSRHKEPSLDAAGLRQLFAPFSNAPYTIQYENYTINYLLNNYINAYTTRDPRRIITVFVHLYCLQLCADAFIAAESGTLPDLDTQSEIFSKTARFFEHSTQAMDNLHKIFLDNGLAETDALLSLV